MIKKSKLFGLAAVITAIVVIAIVGVGVASCSGPEGPMGPEGPQGPAGSSGTGADGSDGSDGSDGQDGENGSNLIFYTITYEPGTDETYIAPTKVAEGTSVHRPDNIPVRAFDFETVDPGLYRAGGSGWIFNGWFLDGELYNFDAPVTSNITLTAEWLLPGKATDEEVGKSPADSDFIQAAFEFIEENPRSYVLNIADDYIIGGTVQKLDGTGVHLTIIGKGGEERTITSNTADGMLFEINNKAGLTLGKNITLQGKTGATAALLVIANIDSNFTMEEGSKITGHTTSSTLGVVFNNSGSSFTMNGGEISGNAAQNVNAGVVNMAINNDFVMRGGEIKGNTTNMGAVRLGSGSKFTMSGGKITGNTGSYSGVYCAGGNTFTMNNGEISENTGSICGGVYLYSANNVLSSTFTMNNGEISGNTGDLVGGVYVGGFSAANDYTKYYYSTFTMNNGTISGNKSAAAAADNRTGGVLVQGGEFRMYGGTISGNTGASTGGVHIVNVGLAISTAGTFDMRGGTISGNTGADAGGVHFTGNKTANYWYTPGVGASSSPASMYIYEGVIENNGTAGITQVGGVLVTSSNNSNSKRLFDMRGGMIRNNIGDLVSGVYVNNNCAFNMSGSSSITGPTDSTATQGTVYIDNTAWKYLYGDSWEQNNNGIRMSDACSIDTLTLGSNTGVTNYQFLYLSNNWTGSITTFNLFHAGSSNPQTVITYWQGSKTIIKRGTQQADAATIAKFANTKFYFVTSSGYPYYFKESGVSAIYGNYKISDQGMVVPN
jgi:hypothetical protein